MSEPVRSHHSPTLLEETRSPILRLCHRAIFGIVMLVIIAAPLLAGRARPWAVDLLMIAIVIAGCFWVLRVVIVREAQIVFSQLGAPFMALATYALMRYSLAEVEPVARPDMLFAMSGTLLFFLVLNDFRHRWQITTLVWTLTGLGVLLTLMALGQLVRGELPTATFARPADLAVYLLIVLPVAAANFFFSRRSMPAKVCFAFAGLLMCSGFVATRAYWHWLGWLAAFLLVALFVIQKRGWRFRWLLIGSCVLAAVLVVTMLTSYTLRHPNANWNNETSSQTTDSPAVRLRNAHPLWKSVVAIGQRNFWVGAGPGMIEWLYPSQRNVQASVRRSGNEYCNIFAESGVIGCALALWVVISFVVAVVQILNLRAGRYSVAQQSNRFAFAISGLAVVAAMAINAAVDLNLRVAGSSFTLLIIMGAVLTCGVHRRVDEEEPVHQPGRYTTLRMRGASRLVLAGGLVILLLLLLTRLAHTFPAAWFLRNGDRAAQQLNWTAAEHAYLRAWKFDARNFETAAALGDLYSARATWNTRQRETLGLQALSWYRRAHTINAYAYDVLIRIGRIEDLLGQRDEAAKAFEEAVQNDSHNASYHAQFGWHYERWGQHELAQRSFRLARQFGAVENIPAVEMSKVDPADS